MRSSDSHSALLPILAHCKDKRVRWRDQISNWTKGEVRKKENGFRHNFDSETDTDTGTYLIRYEYEYEFGYEYLRHLDVIGETAARVCAWGQFVFAFTFTPSHFLGEFRLRLCR